MKISLNCVFRRPKQRNNFMNMSKLGNSIVRYFDNLTRCGKLLFSFYFGSFYRNSSLNREQN